MKIPSHVLECLPEAFPLKQIPFYCTTSVTNLLAPKSRVLPAKLRVMQLDKPLMEPICLILCLQELYMA